MVFCAKSNQESYPFVLPPLPYNKEDFAPYFSKETFEYHHEKHHNAYVTNLNNLLQNDDKLNALDLEQVILAAKDTNVGVFNNAAQVWNHTFFWHSIKPNGGGRPTGKIAALIDSSFGSFDDFVQNFKQAAVSQFGSGWAWLVMGDNNVLQIVKTSNAETPITSGLRPLLACDVWEHAYYIDYRNKRPDYVGAILEHLINWDFAEEKVLI